MEHIEQKINVLKGLLPALLLVGVIVAAGTIFYGVESVAPGVHDAFHDFRHVVGMPCH